MLVGEHDGAICVCPGLLKGGNDLLTGADQVGG